jgi:hypothetical protein
VIKQGEVMSKQYLYRVSILSKKSDHPLATCAYYCGEHQYDVINSQQYTSHTSDKVVWSNVIIPERDRQHDLYSNLPDYLKFKTQKPDLISNARNILWMSINNRETRADSQFARLFSLAIPYFLTQVEAINLLSNFAKVLVSDGMIADCALHSISKKPAVLSLFEQMKLMGHNEKAPTHEESLQDYSAYLMCTLRSYRNGQFENKNRDWNSYQNMIEWRTQWLDALTYSINNASQASEEEKAQWLNKLTIYNKKSNTVENSQTSLKMV